MAQPVNAAGGELKPKPRASSRVSNALKTGVVYGGSAVLTAVNNITPHIAGAVDILVIEQPDGSRKATPFYVRFGKYTALRERQRNVKLYINDELAPFDMHIGLYGQAYLATEGIEVRGGGDEDEHEALLAGMMSPPSGYSSGTDEPSPKQDGGESAVTLSDVRQCNDGLKEVRRTSGMAAAGTASGSRGARVPLPALGVEAGASGNPSSAAATAASLAATTAMARVSDDRSALGDKLSALSQAQLAPALSVTDRTESFLSARETLAGPLGDELIVSMLGGVSPTAPDYQPQPGTGAQQASFHLVAPPQRQGPGVLSGAYPSAGYPRDSVNSLGTVSEGTSPCGWSEDEEETAAGTAWRPAEAEAASPAVIESVQDQDTMLSLSSEPQLQQGQMQVAASAHVSAMSQCQPQGQMQWHHHHHASLQQPFHQQLGFPENASAGFSATAATNSVSEPEGVAAPLRPVSSPTGFEGGCSGPLDTQLGGRGLYTFEADAGPSLEHSNALGATAPLVPAGAATVPLQSSQPLSHMGIPSAAWDAHRSSPGSVFDVLSIAPRTDDCCAGQGQGSHSAVSLLSCSLRDSGGGGSGFPGGIGGNFETSGAGRSSSDLLGAKGDVAPASATAVARSPSGIDGVLLASSGTVGGPVGLIAAAAVAAGASVTRPWLAVDSHKEQSVKLSLTATHDCCVRVSLMVLPLLPTAPACIGPTGSHRGAFSSGGGSREAAEGGSPSMSDGGYLGDGEQGSVAAAAALRQQHHGSHHHHYHYAHGHGHLHSRHGHNGFLHSTSAPLPSSSIHAAGAIGAETAATVAGAAVEVRASADTTARNGMPVHGIELSLCGDHLKRSMPYSEACTLFDMHRVSEEVFFSRFHEISGDPRLTIRLSNGIIFPCQQLSYGLLGLLAFGTWRLPPGTPSWGPEGIDVAGASEAAATATAAAAAMLAAAVAQGAGVAAADAPKGGSAGAAVATASNATTPKKGQAAAGAGTGSWRLWMFGARREGGRTSTVGCNSSVNGAAACISARSPPLTSPVSERTVENPSVSIGVYNVPQPLLATGQARPLLPGQPYTLEGSNAATAIAAIDHPTGGQLPTGGSSSSAGPAVSREIGRSQSCNVVTKKSLTPTAEQLAVLPLKHGQNTIMYKVGASELRAYVYFLPWRTRIVISDIDGTITKSDVLGHLLPAMGLDWSHPGIAKLLTNIRQNNYLIMYLSSRSIGQANITRDFINTLVQGEHRMPLGPVIISPHGLLPSLYREMILRRPHEFKIATLRDIRALFPADWNPFYGGFGNRDTDEISYREVGVQASRIFIINPRGELRQPADSSPREELPANSNSSATTLDAAKAQSQEDAAVSADGDAVAEQLSDTAVAPAAKVVSQLSRELSSRSGGAGGSIGRGASGSTVATPTSMHLSTLSAINELVHDIFPPLRDGQPMTPVGDRRDENSGAQLHEDVGADATVGQDSGTRVRMGEGKEEAPEEGNDASEEGDSGAAADGTVPAERSPEGEPNGSQPTGVDKGSDSYHRGAAAAAAALVGPVCETGCSGSTEADAVAKLQATNLNSSSEGKQSPGGSQSVATPRSASPPHSSSPAASMTGDQQTAPVDDVDTAVVAHAVAPCEVSSGLLDHGEASGAVDAPINFRAEAVLDAAASCSIEPSATVTNRCDAANRSAGPAVGGSCSVSIPGIAPGAAVVDEVVATAMPLPA
ncbi:hypothetical protein Vretimale_3799 [Volvox reticuliferus]|uniref:LNS2/PITP domain-containing protein n=1 Tax=Volvox reticuliferus TaxID=1737510 RepID=A0A8J4G1Y1_9CHLO|nr:hypothetical protein Vretimale_3799 [Volvox reticuliferus]